MRSPLCRVLAAAACTALLPAAAVAEGSTAPVDGAREYAENCAVCHGAGGAGDGPLADRLEIASTDLRYLAFDNGGRFPRDRVRALIDGRAEVASHGPRMMPVWGWEYRYDLQDREGPAAVKTEAAARIEAAIAARIEALVEHLDSIQRPGPRDDTRG